MNFISVCSGIEAASVAWTPLGFKCLGLSEIAPFPRAVLKHHYPEVPLHGDFTKIRPVDVDGSVRLIAGGTPCQSFSIAGLRRGLDDERGNLALEYVRLADRLRPYWLVWENVAGVLSSWDDDPSCKPRPDRENAGRLIVRQRSSFGTLCAALAELGYGLAWRVLDTQFVRVEHHPRAIPQRRRRVILVGCLGGWTRASAALFEPGSMRGDPPPRRQAWQDVAGTLGGSSQSGGFRTTDLDGTGAFIPEVATTLTSGAAPGTPAHSALSGATKESNLIPEVANPLTARMAKGLNTTMDEVQTMIPVAHTLRSEGFDASEDGTGRGTPIIPVAFDPTQVTSPTNRSKASDVSPTMSQSGRPAVVVHGSQDPDVLDGVAHTIGRNAGRENSLLHFDAIQWRVRRLTCVEAERLQGFRDGYTQVPYRGKPAERCPDGPRYASLGNTMSTNVIRWVGERIAIVDALGEV